MWLSDWWATRKRAEALRRLGGPDLDAEQRANAMNGEQKVWVLTAWAIAALLGWLIWSVAGYYSRALDANPSPASIMGCVNQCAASCASAAEVNRE